MKKTNTKKKDKAENKPVWFPVESIWTFLLITLIIFIIWYAIGRFIYHHYFTTTPTFAGQFGDMFGVTNSLFSGLTFAGLIYTILLQRKEINNANIESNKQKVRFNRQRFESTFFNMLSIHYKILENIRYENQNGLEAMNIFLDRYEERNDGMTVTEIEPYIATYKIFSTHFTRIISPYLQSLISLFYIIVDAQLGKKAEKRYFTLLRAYISLTERKFLYYHILLAPDTGNKELLEELNKRIKLIDKFPDEYLLRPHHGEFKKYIKPEED